MLKNIVKNLPFTSIYRRVRDNRYYNKLQQSSNKSPYGFEYFGDIEFSSEREGNDVRILNIFFSDNDVFIDVGANIGYYSLLAHKKGLEVLSIEPVKNNYELIKKSFYHNKFSGDLRQLALSDFVGTAKIYGGRQGGSLLKGWGNISKNYYDICEVNTLDNILGNRFLDKRVLLKIDAEGVEYSILKGAVGFLTANNSVTLYLENGFKENFGGKVNPNFKNVFEFYLH